MEVKAAVPLSGNLMEGKETQFEEAAGTKQGALNNGLVSCTRLRTEGKGKMKPAGMRESGPGRETVWVRGNSYCAETCEGASVDKNSGVQLLK